MPVASRYARVLEEALVMIEGLTIAASRALTGHDFHSRSKASRTDRIPSFGVLANVGLRGLIAFSRALENSQTFVSGFFAWRHSYSPVEKRRLYHCVIRNPMKAELNYVISGDEKPACRSQFFSLKRVRNRLANLWRSRTI